MPRPVRRTLAAFVNDERFQNAILALILLNGIILALDAIPAVEPPTQELLRRLDRVIVWVFIVEIVLRIVANGRSFFRDGWSLYDLVVVAVSAPGTLTGVSALRILRALRLLRILSGVSELRRVGEALVAAVPGISWVLLILVLINVMAAIIGTNLFGPSVPEYFGDLFTSMFTLFKVMTLEDWPEVADAVLSEHPRGWIFFLLFIVTATFTTMNLFVGVIVSVMDRETSTYYQWEREYRSRLREDLDTLMASVRELDRKVEALSGGKIPAAREAGGATRTPGPGAPLTPPAP